MQVTFSNHAWERCKQRGISAARIQSRLQSVPRCDGTFEWHFNRTLTAIYAMKDNRIVVITVYEKQKQRGRRRF